MNPPDTNDPLDALLRDQNQYIEDNGFTRRVMAALPQPRPRFRLRSLLLLAITTLGSVLVVMWLPWKNLPALDLQSILSLNSQILSPWLLVFTVLASLIWAIIAAVQLED
jgi:hypothetical protein